MRLLISLLALASGSYAFMQGQPIMVPMFSHQMQTMQPSITSNFRPVNTENSEPPKCKSKVVDGETLLKVIHSLIEDIPNICLSKFKLCGGFNEDQRRSSWKPVFPEKAMFPDFWRAKNGNETADGDDNGNSTSTHFRHRRSAEDADEYDEDEEKKYSDYYGGSKRYGKQGSKYNKYGSRNEYGSKYDRDNNDYGYSRGGYDRGYDDYGYSRGGYDRGHDDYGYSRGGYDRGYGGNGYSQGGYDQGYNDYGYSRGGYDRDYDAYGYSHRGYYYNQYPKPYYHSKGQAYLERGYTKSLYDLVYDHQYAGNGKSAVYVH